MTNLIMAVVLALCEVESDGNPAAPGCGNTPSRTLSAFTPSTGCTGGASRLLATHPLIRAHSRRHHDLMLIGSPSVCVAFPGRSLGGPRCALAWPLCGASPRQQR